MKNFNQPNWLQCLAAKNWESIGDTECVNEMAVQFSKLVNEALDDIAPIKTVTIRPGYVAGLSENTKYPSGIPRSDPPSCEAPREPTIYVTNSPCETRSKNLKHLIPGNGPPG